MPEQLAQGTPVVFKAQGLDLTGRVCGIAQMHQPGIGAIYIVHVNEEIGPTYPYTHLALPEIVLTVAAGETLEQFKSKHQC